MDRYEENTIAKAYWTEKATGNEVGAKAIDDLFCMLNQFQMRVENVYPRMDSVEWAD